MPAGYKFSECRNFANPLEQQCPADFLLESAASVSVSGMGAVA
jgi:hypothetical protein